MAPACAAAKRRVRANDASEETLAISDYQRIDAEISIMRISANDRVGNADLAPANKSHEAELSAGPFCQQRG